MRITVVLVVVARGGVWVEARGGGAPAVYAQRLDRSGEPVGTEARIGGGVAGSVGGIFWVSHRWDGVALFSAVLMMGVLVVALALSRTSTAR